jgi:endonuclease/exonuclease/phosphatase family metal-dependent hydrolase
LLLAGTTLGCEPGTLVDGARTPPGDARTPDTCGDSIADRDPDVGIDASKPTTSELKIVSWNVWHGNSEANFVAALKEFEERGIDIVGFQELADHDKPAALADRAGCAGCTFDAWIPGSPGKGGNVSIIWNRSRFSVAADAQGDKMRFAVKVHGPEEVEDGAGGSTTTSKYIVLALLNDNETGRSVWIMNGHALPTVEKDCGHPSDKPKRLALYEKMMDAFKAELGTRPGPVFITGDFNVNYRCDKKVRHFRFPWASFNSLEPQVKSNWEWHELAGLALPAHGTHKPHKGGKRIIDYVFARADPDVSYKGKAIWSDRRFGSDHAPVRVSYMIRHGLTP